MCLVLFFYSESLVQQGRMCHTLLSLSNTEQLSPFREHITSLFLEQIKASRNAQNTTGTFTSWYRKAILSRAFENSFFPQSPFLQLLFPQVPFGRNVGRVSRGADCTLENTDPKISLRVRANRCSSCEDATREV